MNYIHLKKRVHVYCVKGFNCICMKCLCVELEHNDESN